MDYETAPEGHIWVDTNSYKRFLQSVNTPKYLVRIQTKEMWDRQLNREHSQQIKRATNRKSKPKNSRSNPNRNKLLENEEWRKKRYHKSVWKNMDYGDITKAGPVKIIKK